MKIDVTLLALVGLGLGLAFPPAILEAEDSSEAPLIIAHRGDSSKAPENTHAAISKAIEARADLVEFDVRVTADGALVLFHDETLSRFTKEKTPFASLGFEAARKLDVGSWFEPETKAFASERPPTLDEAIQACIDGETIALIERKTGSAEAYVESIRRLKAEKHVVMQAFDWKFLEEFRKLAPEISLGALGSKAIDSERLEILKRLKPDWVGWNQKYLDRSEIDRFHEMGFQVAVWTVNDLARLRQFAGWGVDALITDRPAEARAAVLPASSTRSDQP